MKIEGRSYSEVPTRKDGSTGLSGSMAAAFGVKKSGGKLYVPTKRLGALKKTMSSITEDLKMSATTNADMGGLLKRHYAGSKGEAKMPRRKVKRMMADKHEGKKSAGFGRMLKSRSRGPADSDRDDYKGYA
ncbi:MAG: hypothetical protein MOGMAGMI_02007 [Candidatus Omnitrophica bacterium]|nr:hypothetical protein [Candidatus Omnitrophota bacterium]